MTDLHWVQDSFQALMLFRLAALARLTGVDVYLMRASLVANCLVILHRRKRCASVCGSEGRSLALPCLQLDFDEGLERASQSYALRCKDSKMLPQEGKYLCIER